MLRLELFGHTEPEVLFAKKSADDIHKRWYGEAVPIRCKPGPKKTLNEACHTISAVLCLIKDFRDTAGDVSIIESAVAENDTFQKCLELTSNDDRELSAL